MKGHSLRLSGGHCPASQHKFFRKDTKVSVGVSFPLDDDYCKHCTLTRAQVREIAEYKRKSPAICKISSKGKHRFMREAKDGRGRPFLMAVKLQAPLPSDYCKHCGMKRFETELEAEDDKIIPMIQVQTP